ERRAGAGAGAVIVCDRDGNGVAAAGRRVEIMMADAAEGDQACGKVDAAVAAAVTPVDVHGVGVETGRVREVAAQGRGAVLVDGRGVQAQLQVGWLHIIDSDTGAATRAGAVTIGYGNANA